MLQKSRKSYRPRGTALDGRTRATSNCADCGSVTGAQRPSQPRLRQAASALIRAAARGCVAQESVAALYLQREASRIQRRASRLVYSLAQRRPDAAKAVPVRA